MDEIRDLDAIRNGQGAEALAANKELFATERVGENAELRARIAGLTDADYTRLPAFAEREAIQVTNLIQFFNRKSKVVQDCWFKFFISSCKWNMKKVSMS